MTDKQFITSDSIQMRKEHHISADHVIPEKDWVDKKVPIEVSEGIDEFIIEKDGELVSITAGSTVIKMETSDFLAELSRYFGREIRNIRDIEQNGEQNGKERSKERSKERNN